MVYRLSGHACRPLGTLPVEPDRTLAPAGTFFFGTSDKFRIFGDFSTAFVIFIGLLRSLRFSVGPAVKREEERSPTVETAVCGLTPDATPLPHAWLFFPVKLAHPYDQL